MNYLTQLIISLPPFVFLLIFVFVSLALYFLLILLQSVPALKFLFFDIDALIYQIIQPQKYYLSRNLSNEKLQTKLLMLLHGDIATAKRLLRQQRKLIPGQTTKWYLEKVIYDLERDRH